MKQQIRGWRFATLMTPSRRAARAIPPRPVLGLTMSVLCAVCRGLGRGAVSAGAASRDGLRAVNVARVAGGAGLLVAGVGIGRWAVNRVAEVRGRAPKNRWIMVTINCSPQRLATRADLPEPIIRLGDAVDLKIAPAPGDRGTELGARLRDVRRMRIAGMVARRPELHPRHIVERALREAKSIIEAGEVLRPDRSPAPQPPAQAGRLLEFTGHRGGRR